MSWSASDALVVLALAEGRSVGVDVGRLGDARLAERMAARWFPFEEARFAAEAAEPAGRSARFTALWCRREACVKAYGGRLAQAPGVSAAGPPRCCWPARARSEPVRWGCATCPSQGRTGPRSSPSELPPSDVKLLYWQVS
ncbi:4'-phosphopantetheinyl transferase superfamily protein [Kitasatospora sp. NPDC017646]|uniref:4'-phosphopantetheinyl transferase superfamily protein n=1 Tax=Kitasatospora sp. NPDC017646 TaxID=3364024 RepID=UPI00379C5312